jgi:hypothetical protein
VVVSYSRAGTDFLITLCRDCYQDYFVIPLQDAGLEKVR